ncbi:MAG TPA: LysE family transporter [Geminicoccaceae bacterium]|nr:LysE family transporter [Geminicoccaceae bacterium]
MEELGWLFLKGLALGVSVAAPVGPMSLLCMRASLAHGFGAGAASGLGVAAADGAYAAVAAFGVTVIARLLDGIGPWLGLAGGGFLVWFGARTMLRPPAAGDAAGPRPGLAGSFLATFLLTLANPPTIMFFAAMFAGLGLAAASAGSVGAGALVLGVFLGSLAWFTALSATIAGAGARLTPAALAWINRLSGLALAAFGLWALARAARQAVAISS